MAIQVDGLGRPTTCSGGGPVIAVPAESAGAWRGTLPPIGAVVPEGWRWGSSGGPVCDYDRACDAQGIRTGYGGFAWLEVGGRPALILDAELVTVFVADADGGYILRGGDIDGPHADPATVPADGWKAMAPETIELTDGRLFLFDSAFAGDPDPAAITAHDGVAVAELGPGAWRVEFATNEHEVDFVRFRRA
jgi:hypothetical protein